MDPRIARLRRILRKQIDWYKKNQTNEGLIYDELWSEFAGLAKGAYVEIIETVLESD